MGLGKLNRVILMARKGVVDLIEAPSFIKVHVLDMDIVGDEGVCRCGIIRGLQSPHYHVKFKKLEKGNGNDSPFYAPIPIHP